MLSTFKVIHYSDFKLYTIFVLSIVIRLAGIGDNTCVSICDQWTKYDFIFSCVATGKVHWYYTMNPSESTFGVDHIWQPKCNLELHINNYAQNSFTTFCPLDSVPIFRWSFFLSSENVCTQENCLRNCG